MDGLFSGETMVYVLFIAVRVPLLLSIMPTPVLRSMMSKIVSVSEQGKNLNSVEQNIIPFKINFHFRCYCILQIMPTFPEESKHSKKKSRTLPIHMNSELLMAGLYLVPVCLCTGAVFACIAFVDMLSVGVAFAMFSSIYAFTLSWFPGFSFLLAAGLTIIPTTLIW